MAQSDRAGAHGTRADPARGRQHWTRRRTTVLEEPHGQVSHVCPTYLQDIPNRPYRFEGGHNYSILFRHNGFKKSELNWTDQQTRVIETSTCNLYNRPILRFTYNKIPTALRRHIFLQLQYAQF